MNKHLAPGKPCEEATVDQPMIQERVRIPKCMNQIIDMK